VQAKGFEDTFSEALGSEFLKEIYDYPPAVLTEKLSAHVLNGVRCIRYLGNYRTFGTFIMLRQKRKDYQWLDKDQQFIEPYLKFVYSSPTTDSTKMLRIQYVKTFYEYLKFKRIEGISDMSSEVISGYILSMHVYSPVYAMHRLRTLKFYFKFLYENGFLEKDLTIFIPRIQTPKNKNIPALWSKDEIVKLLDSVDRGSPLGKRNYAILLLAVQLGIRISDIANLKLDHLKWERKEIEFRQQKSGTKVIYPMLDEIGWSIIDYIRYGRPKTDSTYLFMSCRAPYVNLRSGALGDIIRRQMRRCGIRKPAGTVWGMHSLRHALARNLLEQNVPLAKLSEIMGHTSIESSYPYLKVDIEGLRDCALSLGGIDL
jgi:site-specific recombinase XerD